MMRLSIESLQKDLEQSIKVLDLILENMQLNEIHCPELIKCRERFHKCYIEMELYLIRTAPEISHDTKRT